MIAQAVRVKKYSLCQRNENRYQHNLLTLIFIAILLKMARVEIIKCPSTDERINKGGISI